MLRSWLHSLGQALLPREEVRLALPLLPLLLLLLLAAPTRPLPR